MDAAKQVAAPVEATGTVLHFNKGAAFFRFLEPGATAGEPAGGICLFRPNRLLVGGRRLTTSQLKTVESIGAFLAVGDTVSGLITPRNGARSYVLTTDNKVQVPTVPSGCLKWYLVR